MAVSLRETQELILQSYSEPTVLVTVNMSQHRKD